MTEPSNKSILLISEDITIIETLREAFNGCDIFELSQEDNFNRFNVIVLDDCKLSPDLLDKIISNNNVLNISKNKYENVRNFNRPFSLKDLFGSINKILVSSSKVLKFKDFAIVDNILKYNGQEVDFGSKEMRIIKFLYSNAQASKNTLLREIWGYSEDIETKVLENAINKIRQKFKALNIENFITIDDGGYCINSRYLI